ncbi:hypothetical protein DFH08DRAFT_873316 [Mycena albidolilacea]|uniref:Uncharacterized protein n=1 Tax=Mycena albidolilacea TaxID=1033008 RepID=A0AAD6ZZ09_9AGAR|nr:hypothetical protein DFH08DRAFT_873316 [Mycena albidolilacea]
MANPPQDNWADELFPLPVSHGPVTLVPETWVRAYQSRQDLLARIPQPLILPDEAGSQLLETPLPKFAETTGEEMFAPAELVTDVVALREIARQNVGATAEQDTAFLGRVDAYLSEAIASTELDEIHTIDYDDQDAGTHLGDTHRSLLRAETELRRMFDLLSNGSRLRFQTEARLRTRGGLDRSNDQFEMELWFPHVSIQDALPATRVVELTIYLVASRTRIQRSVRFIWHPSPSIDPALFGQ